jgi:hypothetical protein
MPDRSKSTPGPNPPNVNPARFEDFPAFRETFLAVFTEPFYNTALREIGNLLFEMVLEYRDYWPDQPEGWLRSDLRALVADLRVVQGHLASIGDPDMTSPNTPQEEHHAAVAGRVAEDLRVAADTLELELGPWQGEA